MILLDASAAVEWLIQSPRGIKVERRLFSPAPSIHAPHLLDIEVAQAIRRYVRENSIPAQRGAESLQDLRNLGINMYPHDLLMPRIWELRATLTACDAAYVALAELLGAPLITCDRKIAGASGHSANVEVM